MPTPSLHRARVGPSVSLFVILGAQLMVVLDTTIVNVALPNIQHGLGLSPAGLSWVLNAYILAFGGLLLLGARAGDLLGRRRVFLAGIGLFAASSLAGGLAPAGWVLLAARGLQGAGAALAAPSALSLLTSLFPEGPGRDRAIGLYTTVSAAGGAVGLVAGGFLTEIVSWRWVMFVNVPIGAVVWIVARIVITETERRHGRFDLAGAVTSTLGMGALVFGLVEAGSVGWAEPLTLGSFTASAVLLTSFVNIERNAAEPILPLRLLAHPTRTTANGARALVYAGMYGLFFFMGQFLQDVQHYSPLRAGLAFLPMPAAVFLTSQLTARVLVQRLPPKVVMGAGVALATTSLLLATRVSGGSPYAEIVVSLVLLGAGAGISFVSLTTASLAGVAQADAGAASGLVNVTQQLGAAVGLAVLVTIFGIVTHHAQLGDGAAAAAVTRGLHAVFGVGAFFTLAAITVIATVIRTHTDAPALDLTEDDAADELSWLEEAPAHVA